MTSSLQPFMFLCTALGVGGALVGVHRQLPAAIPWIFAFSALGALWRAVALREQERAFRAQGSVDHAALRALDFSPYRAWLKENVRGHDRAVDALVEALQRGLKLAQPGRSLGAFMLVGPTGTGKTFLSLMTAKALWPENEAVVLRMNQYKSPTDVAALLGATGGAEGLLTQALAENPQRVVLLDEVDKCHPDVLHGLFDALDGGKCRDKATGRMLDFSGCLFFATCNAGHETLRALDGFAARPSIAKARDVLAREAGFDKAFLARFTEIFLLDELKPYHVAEIAGLLLLKQWREQGLDVSYVEPELIVEAVKANEEFGPYGVRQLAHCVRRLTDRMMEDARTSGAREVRLSLAAGAKPS